MYKYRHPIRGPQIPPEHHNYGIAGGPLPGPNLGQKPTDKRLPTISPRYKRPKKKKPGAGFFLKICGP